MDNQAVFGILKKVSDEYTGSLVELLRQEYPVFDALWHDMSGKENGRFAGRISDSMFDACCTSVERVEGRERRSDGQAHTDIC